MIQRRVSWSHSLLFIQSTSSGLPSAASIKTSCSASEMELIKNNSVGVKSEAVVGKYYLTDLFGRPPTGVHSTSHQLAGRAHVSRRQHRREETIKTTATYCAWLFVKMFFPLFPLPDYAFERFSCTPVFPRCFSLLPQQRVTRRANALAACQWSCLGMAWGGKRMFTAHADFGGMYRKESKEI